MAITIKDLNFSYDRKKSVLKGISFDVRDGEVLAIVGASGCGKSTLLKIISGLVEQSSINELSFQKLEIDGLKPGDYVDQGRISFMFQEPTLFPNLSVLQNLLIPLRIKGEKNNEPGLDIIKKLGLYDFKDTLPYKLSGGMKTRVSLGRSFINDPKLLMLDEPFTALDIGWKIKLYQEFVQLKIKINQTVLLVTHDIEEALLLSNNILVLNKNGSIISNHKVHSKVSLNERVFRNYEFLHDPIINELYLTIQKQIIDDSKRDLLTKHEFEENLNDIIKAAGTYLEQDLLIKNKIIEIRNYSDNAFVHDKLREAFNKGTIEFKYSLIWDLLNFQKISESTISVLFEFYFKHLDIFCEKSKTFYQANNSNYFEVLKGRIEQNNIPEFKKWIYLCDMFGIKDRDGQDKTKEYLSKIIGNRVSTLKGDFNILVAKRVLDKIEN